MSVVLELTQHPRFAARGPFLLSGLSAAWRLPRGLAHLEICLGRLSNTGLSFRFGLSNARASDTHGPNATFPKLPMQKNLVGGC